MRQARLLEFLFPNKTEIESDQEQNSVNDGTQAINFRPHAKVCTDHRYRSAGHVEVKEYARTYEKCAR